MTINGSVTQVDIRLIGKHGDWICSGEGYSGESQTTRVDAFASWLATFKARAQYRADFQQPRLAGRS